MNIFLDTQDMEERYGEELYKEYLENENKQLKERIDKAIEFLHNNTMIGHCKEHYELLEILGDKENE